MYFTTTDKFQLYYEYHNNSNKKETLVLLNGLSQSTVAWVLMVPDLLSNYNLLLLDFIFQGQSDKHAAQRTFDDHATDLKNLLDFLSLEKVSVGGLSYGSLVAQHFALLFPERLNKLVLMSTFAHKTPYFEIISNSWQKALEAGGYALMFEVMLPTVLGENYFNNPLIPIDLMRQSRKGANEDARALLKLMRATSNRGDFRKELQKISCPALIIHGTMDLLLPVHLAEAVQENIPGSRLELIPGVGHTLNIEAIPQVCSAIKAFV